MGLLVSVYRSDMSDSTNNGVSKHTEDLCVVNVDGPFEPSEKFPAVKLVAGPCNSVKIVPVALLESGKWTMAGGNFAGTSDSRFGEAVEKICGYNHRMISIHDRVEN